jgi:predicted PurR-regulated permease PerM
MSETTKPAAEGAGPAKSKAEKDEKRVNGLPARNGKASAAGTLQAFDPWARASHVALIGLFVIALLWATYVARPVIVPVLLAWVIATIVLPIVTWLYTHKIPRVVAVLAVTLALLVLMVSLLLLLSTPVTFWLGRATELSVLVKQKLQTMNQPLAMLDEARKALNAIAAGGTQPAMKVEQESATLVTTVFAVLTPAVTQFVLFIGALIFYLIYQTQFRNTVVLLFPDRDVRLTTLHILSDVDENMTKYFGTFTVVNLCLGAATVLLTWTVGLPNPLLWGVLAALLNYIPYIGPSIVVVTLGVVGLLTYPTLGEALIAPLIFLGIVTIEGQFLTPAFMGRRLELNPFAVFLAVAFCTWLLGPIGAFLAVPLLMAAAVTLGHAFGEQKPALPE